MATRGEAAYGVAAMNSPADLVFGMGYSHGFDFFGYKVFYLHNGYVTILYNFGVIGLCLFSVFGWRLFALIREVRRADPFLSNCGLAYGFALLIQNFSSSIVNREQSGTIAMLTFALIMVSSLDAGRWEKRLTLPATDGLQT